MTRSSLLALACLCAVSACAPTPKKVLVDPAIAAQATLAEADANLRAGCFDCLVDALKQYESARSVPAVADAAAIGVLRAAGLLGLRERELGTTDSAYLERARELVAISPALKELADTLLDLISIMPWRVAANRPGLPDSTSIAVFANRTQRLAGLQQAAGKDEVAAYLFVAYACESGEGLRMGNGAMKAAVGPFADVPLVAYRLAICSTSGLKAIDDIVALEPRYKEAAFYKGLSAIRAQKLDEADARYREAYAWRQTWPAATLAIANVSITAEEFEASADFYDRTLALAPDYPDALLGKVRALTYLDKREEAMAVADRLITIGRLTGDAYYWKAYNEWQLQRLDAAWSDVEAADKIQIDSEVPKLAGLIAIDRKQYEIARGKLETSQQRNSSDCHVGYYLHLVLTELRTWERAVTAANSAVSCLDGEIAGTRAEIERIRKSEQPEARKARMMAGRERRVTTDTRMIASCWYNAAVSSYNLAKKDEARAFAEKIADDEEFGERAKRLLSFVPRP